MSCFEHLFLWIFLNLQPQNPLILGCIFEPIAKQVPKIKNLENMHFTKVKSLFLRSWALKQTSKRIEKPLQMRVPKKHPENLSENRNLGPVWPPKPRQNQGKIVSKTTSKKMQKKTKKTPKTTCLSMQREARVNMIESV